MHIAELLTQFIPKPNPQPITTELGLDQRTDTNCCSSNWVPALDQGPSKKTSMKEEKKHHDAHITSTL